MRLLDLVKWIYFLSYLEWINNLICNKKFTNRFFFCSLLVLFVGFAYQGKDIAFRFIVEYSNLMDFGP
jgi:hypothetical protein